MGAYCIDEKGGDGCLGVVSIYVVHLAARQSFVLLSSLCIYLSRFVVFPGQDFMFISHTIMYRLESLYTECLSHRDYSGIYAGSVAWRSLSHRSLNVANVKTSKAESSSRSLLTRHHGRLRESESHTYVRSPKL